MSYTIKQINDKHIGHVASESGISRDFVPAVYKSFAETRYRIKVIMESTGYNSLTQIEKELCGRWYLLFRDQSEMDNLFSSQEQEEIYSFINKYTYHLISSRKVDPIATIGDPTIPGITSYITKDEFLFEGSTHREILNIKVIACCESGTEYSIRVYDADSNNTIVEKNSLTNTTRQIINLGEIIYTPNSNTTLEVQVKRDSSDSGEIHYVSASIDFI